MFILALFYMVRYLSIRVIFFRKYRLYVVEKSEEIFLFLTFLWIQILKYNLLSFALLTKTL